MNLAYTRFRIFTSLKRPFSARNRQRRMAMYCSTFAPHRGQRILDLGGQPMIWDHVAEPLDITILNLPGIASKEGPSQHAFHYVEGDACNVTCFDDKEFDIVFSNSVIEHVGDDRQQAMFASEVRRLGKSYWVQTPSIWFPIEAHCGMPFWWFYPETVRRRFIERWRKKLPAWTKMVEESRVLSVQQLRRLFPEASILTEYYFGVPKSYIAYSKSHTSPKIGRN